MAKKQGNAFWVTFLVLTAIILLVQISIFFKICAKTDHFSAKIHTFSIGASQVQEGGSPDHEVWDRAVEGDWLVWAMKAEPKTVNPLSVDRDIYSKWIAIPNIFEPLLDYDFETLTLKPCLAQSYEMSEDGLEIVFTLRDDIHFSDGTPITVDDVLFTYETIMNPEVDASSIAQSFRYVKEAVRISDRQVKFLMTEKSFKTLDVLSFWDTGILPKHVYGALTPLEFNQRVSEPIGSGPYVFDSWRVGEKLVLKRNENYWGKKPYLKRIVYKFISNDRASLKALLAKDVDIIRPSEDQFAEYADDPQFNEEYLRVAYWNPAVAFYSVVWNQRKPFFKDAKVRQAMTHLINRHAIVDDLLKGSAEVVTGPFYLKSDAYDKKIEPLPFDIETAKTLLREAGWVDSDGDGLLDKDGLKFSFHFLYASSSAAYERIAKLMKDDFAKVGIEVIPDPMEWSILIGKVNERVFDSVIIGWGGDMLADPYQIWHSSQIANRGSNFASFSNPEVDSLIDEANRELDAEKRNAMLRQIHTILHEQQPYTFLYTVPSLRFVDKRFKNIKIYPLGLNYREWFVPNKLQRYSE